MVNVSIENMQDKIAVTKQIEELVMNAVSISLEQEAFETPCEINILFVDNEEIRRINREEREIDSPTDVLSFPIVDMKNGKIISCIGDIDMESNLVILGDIVISLEMAQKQAQEYQHSFERELAFLTTHGVFHLLGYDHENQEDENIMIGKQEAVLKVMGLERK